MREKRVILVRTNTLDDHDIRLPKEIAALKSQGYRLTLLCWDRKGRDSQPLPEKKDGFSEIKVRLKAPTGTKILFFLPIWWFLAFIHLMLNKWDIAHALNFDSVVPASVAGKLKRKPVIYEILETYEDRAVFPRPLRYFFIHVDRLFMRLSSAVILADEGQNEELYEIPNRRLVTVYDSPHDVFGKTDNTVRQEDGTFTIFQALVLSKMKQSNIDKLFTAVKDVDNIKLILAGYGDLADEIQQLANEMPHKIKFLGKIEHDETLARSQEANLLFELRSSAVPQHKHICGSKLLQAMMCGRPFLANKNTATADKVSKENCGLVVDADNIAEIREAIVKLRDNPELCRELGANARKAYEQQYKWEIMEQRLLALYQELTESEKG